jgi:hypothetical protein
MQKAEETIVVLDFPSEEPKDEHIADPKIKVKESEGKSSFLAWSISNFEGNLPNWWDPGDGSPPTRKQLLKRVFLLPVQAVSVLVLFACTSIAYFLFRDSEENEE